MNQSLTSYKQKVQIMDLGLVDYSTAYEYQMKSVLCVLRGAAPIIILCEHQPVYTLGRIASENNFLVSKEDITKRGADIIRIDRGGEVTFHGPGQIVAYPIFDLTHHGKDLKLYMSKLEQVAIDLLSYFGIVANRVSMKTGVFAGKNKIASIGIGVRQWVSFHGLAVNISTDLSFFDLIKPCGLDVIMASMKSKLGSTIDINVVKEKLITCFHQEFNLESTF